MKVMHHSGRKAGGKRVKSACYDNLYPKYDDVFTHVTINDHKQNSDSLDSEDVEQMMRECGVGTWDKTPDLFLHSPLISNFYLVFVLEIESDLESWKQ